MDFPQDSTSIPTIDHEAAPGYNIVHLVGGPADGDGVWTHLEQGDVTVQGERYLRVGPHRFVSETLLIGMFGGGK